MLRLPCGSSCSPSSAVANDSDTFVMTTASFFITDTYTYTHALVYAQTNRDGSKRQTHNIRDHERRIASKIEQGVPFKKMTKAKEDVLRAVGVEEKPSGGISDQYERAQALTSAARLEPKNGSAERYSDAS